METLIEYSEVVWSLFTLSLPILGTVFAVYFSIQKITKKVVVQFTNSFQLFSEPYISELTITNKRDNTLCIWSVHATIHQDIRIELDKFDAPLILKPYEAISLSLPKFSAMTIGSDEYEPAYSFENTKIYLDIGSKFLLCQTEEKKNILSTYRRAEKHTFKFNGHVYNKEVAYILVYFFEQKSYTAFISEHGIIGNEWDFLPNHLAKNVTVVAIKNMLKQFGYDKLFSNFVCYRVKFPKTQLAFKKLSNGEIS